MDDSLVSDGVNRCPDIIPDLPDDSFFYEAFNNNMDTVKAVMNTPYLQAMKKGILPAEVYCCLSVSDSFFCYRAASTLKSILCKIRSAGLTELVEAVEVTVGEYEVYNERFKRWGINGFDCIVPSDTVKAYSEHEYTTMLEEEPIYGLVAFMPCLFLWPWMSKRIMDSDDYSPGVYACWFNGNYWGEDSYNSAKRIGWLVENWKKSGKPFDEEKAFSIYKKSMDFELRVFTEAWNGN